MLREATLLHRRGRVAEAACLYREILARNPKNADALHLLGVLEAQRGNPSAAIELLDRAIKAGPENAAFFSNRGNTLRDLRRFDDALADYDRAVSIDPDSAEAFNNRGNVLRDLQRFDDALESYDRALALDPRYAAACNNRGVVLRDLGRLEEALASYARALTIEHDYAEALMNRGRALHDLHRFPDALASYDRALAVKPDYAEALNNRGALLRQLGRLDEALADYNRTLKLKPDHPEALNNRGNVLQELDRFDEALASYELALAANPDDPFLFGQRLFCKLKIADWRERATELVRLEKTIETGASMPPFAVLAASSSARLQKRNAELYGRERCRGNFPPLVQSYEHDRIRLGYFSADFHNHATAYLIAGLIERHDRERFEVVAFSFGPQIRDSMRTRLERAFDRFIEVNTMSDAGIVSLARSLEIDIAVDLKGFTQDGRPGVFSGRPAPIVVNYLGYPGTLGADHFDYVIADSVLIPENQQQHYAEKIAYLPHTYQVNDRKRPISEKTFSAAECGLPEGGFVFCCFNASYKIAPEIFDVWCRLLKRVEGSVLWLLEDNAAAARNLRAEASARGAGPERLVFAKRLDLAEHLARHQRADLFMDTLPYNAHTAASDALWAGLPVLTCLGETFAGKVAASLLHAAGLPELIARNLEEYEAMALDLAASPERLLMLKQKLAANRPNCPLFDTELFATHIESTYQAMWMRQRLGLPPEHIRCAG